MRSEQRREEGELLRQYREAGQARRLHLWLDNRDFRRRFGCLELAEGPAQARPSKGWSAGAPFCLRLSRAWRAFCAPAGPAR